MRTPKKIVVFSLNYPPFIGGAELAVKEICEHLPQYIFHIITLRRSRSLSKIEQSKNIFIHRIGPAFRGEPRATLKFPGTLLKYYYIFAARKKAFNLQKTEHFDAIWSMMAAYASFAALGFQKQTSLPWGVTLQEGIPKASIYRQALPVWPMFKKIFTRASIVQTISNYLSDLAHEMGARKVVIIPNGVNVAVFEKALPSTVDQYRELLKNNFGNLEQKTILVTASRLDEKNGVRFVLQALAHLPLEVVFVVAGDGPLAGLLKKEADKLGLTKRVLWLGHVVPANLPAIFSLAQIFIRASLSEGLGNAFLEAMAAGLPVVGTNVGGIPDIVKSLETAGEKANGLLVPPGEVSAIVKAINTLRGDPAIAQKLGATGRDFVKSGYDWNTVAGRMDNEFFSKL